MLLTTQLSFSLSLPLLASSQSAETPCVSAKQWSIPSVYFTFFVVPPVVFLSSPFSCCFFNFSYFEFYFVSCVLFFVSSVADKDIRV